MCQALGMKKPTDQISTASFFNELNSRVSETVKKIPKEVLGKPLFFNKLNDNEREKLEKLHRDLNEEYTIRREMLLKRLDVTVNSFLVKF